MSKESLTRYEFDSSDLLLKLDVTLPGDASAVSPVIRRIMAVINEMGCAAGRGFEIELALYEASPMRLSTGAQMTRQSRFSAASRATTRAACSLSFAIQGRDSIPHPSRAPSWARTFSRQAAAGYISSTSSWMRFASRRAALRFTCA